MSGAQAVRLQGSQAALVTLAEQQRQRAIAEADAAFRGACEVVLREHGIGAGTFAPEPGTGHWLLLVAPGMPAPAYADRVADRSPTIDEHIAYGAAVARDAAAAVRKRFTDTSTLLPDEAQRYEALRAQRAAMATATAADDEAPEERVSGAELLAATGVDFGAFGAI